VTAQRQAVAQFAGHGREIRRHASAPAAAAWHEGVLDGLRRRFFLDFGPFLDDAEQIVLIGHALVESHESKVESSCALHSPLFPLNSSQEISASTRSP